MLPSVPMAIPAVDPHFLPLGSCPQLRPRRYGLGRSLRAPSGDTGGACGTVDCATRDAPVPTTNAVAISREVKQFTGEIARGLKDIGTSLFSHSIYDPGFAFLLQADRQLTTDRRRMQCSLRCTVGPTSSPHVIRNRTQP